MGFKKRVMALVLAIAMVMAMATTAFAAGSPKNPGYDKKDSFDYNTQDHNTGAGKLTVVKSKVKTGSTLAVVHAVTSDHYKKSYVDLTVARDINNDKRAITHVGNGSDGIFNSKKGRQIKKVDILTTSSTVKITKKAFYGSNVELLRIRGKKVTIGQNAFAGTNKTNMEIQICGTGRKASQFTFGKGCFNGLSKSATIRVKTSSMSKAQFRLLKAKIEAMGFKGKIEYR